MLDAVTASTPAAANKTAAAARFATRFRVIMSRSIHRKAIYKHLPSDGALYALAPPENRYPLSALAGRI